MQKAFEGKSCCRKTNTEFYVYVYLDPRISGRFYCEKFKFDFEPFYVGKGKNNRYRGLLNTDRNTYENKHLKNKILCIRKENKEPISLKVAKNLSESESFELEIMLINRFGRRSIKTGPLCNLTNGGEGVSGFKQTDYAKRAISRAHKGKTYEEIHGEEKAKKLKIMRGRQMKKRLSGKTYKEIYGEEKAKEISKKQSEFMKNNNPMYIHNIDFSGRKNPNYGKKYTKEERKKHSIIVKKAMNRKEIREKMKKRRKSSNFSKKWKVTTSSGEEKIINNLTLFCEKCHLSYKDMIKVADGCLDNYKKWMCKRV